MKKDLVTAVAVAIFGVLIAYFVSSIFAGDIEGFSFNSLDSTVSTDLSDPDPEVFNYRALNPTVEVYVGNCESYNDYGECLDEPTEQIDEGIMAEDELEDITENATNSSTPTPSIENDTNNQRTP